jgi:hypothetical protein
MILIICKKSSHIIQDYRKTKPDKLKVSKKGFTTKPNYFITEIKLKNLFEKSLFNPDYQ